MGHCPDLRRECQLRVPVSQGGSEAGSAGVRETAKWAERVLAGSCAVSRTCWGKALFFLQFSCLPLVPLLTEPAREQQS